MRKKGRAWGREERERERSVKVSAGEAEWHEMKEMERCWDCVGERKGSRRKKAR